MAKGRPREFDCEQALDKALEVFWRYGYEGASLPELTKAMGINRPSLYAAFGNKEALFRKVLDRYVQGPASHLKCALSAATAKEAVERFLYGAADKLADPSHPRGCMVVTSTLTCSKDAEAIQKEVSSMRCASQKALQMRIEQGMQNGELPADTNAANLARYFTTISHGMSILASSGATRDELRHVVDMAMRAWPEKNQPQMHTDSHR